MIFEAESHVGLTHKLTKLAAQQLGKPELGRLQSDKWLKVIHSTASKTVKRRGPQHAKLELVLHEWFGKRQPRVLALLTDLLLKRQRKLLKTREPDQFRPQVVG